MHGWSFCPDKFYSDNTPIVLGAVSVRTLLTPGHTIGCTSFFWDVVNPYNGVLYSVGMHGGVGANTMNDEYYKTSKVLTPNLRKRFLGDIDKVASIPVDIALPSHPNQIEILDRAGTYTDESQPFLDQSVWGSFIRERGRQVREYDPAAVAAMVS
jgi:metallo-beta-lactamase class B